MGQSGVGKGFREQLCWAGESSGEVKVVLHWEGWRRSVSVCACLFVRVRVCIRKNKELKMGTETPSGKFSSGWLALNNSFFLKKKKGGTQKKMTDTVLKL